MIAVRACGGDPGGFSRRTDQHRRSYTFRRGYSYLLPVITLLLYVPVQTMQLHPYCKLGEKGLPGPK